jgi:DNA-binding response OmpR family regulator
MINLEEMRVLIVDDMDSMRKSIHGILKVLRYGKQFRYANNGAEALSILKAEEIDLLILDWNMPVMSGVELLGRIRENPQLRDLPIVMVTAEATRDIVAEVGEADVDAYVVKPFTVKSLGDRIDAVIEKANNPPPMVFHLKRAKRFQEAGDIDAAIEETKLAVDADPLSSRPIHELGYLYYQKGDLVHAEKLLFKAAQMNNLDVFAFHYLGEISLKQNDIEKATRYFEKAMSISPRHVSRGVYFGKVLIRKGLVDRAEKVLDKAITLSGNSLELIEELAGFCMDEAAYEYAIKMMKAGLKQDLERIDIHIALGNAYERINERLNALNSFRSAESLDPKNTEIKLSIAKNYLFLDQMLRAEQTLNAVMKMDPENQKARELLKKCV